MPYKLLAFLLSELKTVRLKCLRPECMGVTEVTIAKMGARFEVPFCPVCTKPFIGNHTTDNAIVRLAKSIQSLQDQGENLGIEFILPDTK